MPNKNGNAYGLTALCPINNGSLDDSSYAALTRWFLQEMPHGENSPMASVPETYLCRFYVLNDVFYEGYPAKEEHLKSKYLVFCSNFHGELENYLRTMWNSIPNDIKKIWQYCVAFNQVVDADSFINYIKQCQVTNNLFFVGANDESLPEQLKALYLKQEFSRFVFENQQLNKRENAELLRQAFRDFISRTKPENLMGPSWVAGSCTEKINEAVVHSFRDTSIDSKTGNASA